MTELLFEFGFFKHGCLNRQLAAIVSLAFFDFGEVIHFTGIASLNNVAEF